MYSLTEMAKRNSNTTLNYPTTSRAIQLALNPIEVEIDNQRNLCRVERKNGNYGGYMKEILTENLTDIDDALLICEICEGIHDEKLAYLAVGDSSSQGVIVRESQNLQLPTNL